MQSSKNNNGKINITHYTNKKYETKSYILDNETKIKYLLNIQMASL